MSPLLRRVRLLNYKSIAACDVRLGPLMFLVGRNGVGKSNFLDALGFVSDCLRVSLDHALRDRGTIREVRRRSGGHPNNFAIRLEFVLPGGGNGYYSFKIGAKPQGGFAVREERCRLDTATGLGPDRHFHLRDGEVVSTSIATPPAVLPDRLFMVAASGLQEFRAAFDALSRIEIYNINPQLVAANQRPDPGERLRGDGSNAASVFQGLEAAVRGELMTTLSRIVPGTTGLEVKSLGGMEAVEFLQRQAGQPHPWRFPAMSMSDGTLRAFGVLLAISQLGLERQPASAPLVIGLEEPELALHPGAAATLLSALRQGARRGQILITSHSPDLLDNPDIAADALLAVDNTDGLTRIAPPDPAARKTLIEQLFTPGELLRQDQLAPDSDAVTDADERQLRLFADEFA